MNVTHSVVSASPNDPTKEVSSNAWNAAHAITGLVAADIENSTTVGRAVLTAADAAAARTAIGASGEPWTYIKLAVDFTTGSATAVDVTGLAFTPVANLSYEFEAMLLLRTTLGTVNPRVGLAWSTGLTDGGAQINEAQSAAGALTFASGNPNAALLVAVGGLPNTTQSWPATVKGMLIAGASPSGTTRIQLASETAATNVTIKAGSYLKYRTF